MKYTLGDLDMLESFFATFDFGYGIDISYKGARATVTRDFVDERLRLMRLNVTKAKNERYGNDWFELLLELKRQFTHDSTRT